MTYIPDPLELLEMRAERNLFYFQEGICQQCKTRVDYELICPSPMGEGPFLCFECLSPEDQKAYTEFEKSLTESPEQ